MLSLFSCSVDKFIPEGQYLLTKNSVEIDYSDLSETEATGVKQAISDVKNYIRQSPNSKLIIFPLAMRIYCLSSSNPNDTNWINRTLRRQGEAPVIYSQEQAYRSVRQIELLLNSKGCFGSQVSCDTHITKNNRISVVYKIKPQPRYTIAKVETTGCHGNDSVKRLVERWLGESEIIPGNYYDQSVLATFRERTATRLQNRGYYTAIKDNVTFILDTNYGNRTMSVKMGVREFNNILNDTSRHTPPLARYYINKIYVYPDIETLSGLDTLNEDTLHVDFDVHEATYQCDFITNRKMRVRPQTICQSLLIYPGHLYRYLSAERTYTSLWALRNFKFVDMDFVPAPIVSDTAGFLDVRIRLMNAMRHSLSASLEINNTSPLNSQVSTNTGNFGLELGLGYQNKNLFGGAEIFNVKTSLALELSKFAISNNKADFYDLFSSFESGLDLSLDIPKFLVPFPKLIPRYNTRPHTLLSMGVSYQYRTYFERLIGNTSFGYTWQATRYHRHQFLPVEFTLVKFINQQDAFRQRIESLNDLRLKYQYSDHLIFDMRYNFVYSTQRIGSKTNFTYLSLGAESAGNLLYGIVHAANSDVDSAGIYQIYGIPFSQYARFDMEWKHYYYLSQRNTLVLRLAGGIGIPYGNSISMPYEKSFYGGGPTTIRAWRIRTLGPGGYINTSSTTFERVGDISLVFNLEDRFRIFGVFEGAVFADAGNVWLLRQSDEFPDGEFRFDKFYKQIALGAGLGLRVNISILTVRLDFAIPLYNPGYNSDNHWMFDKMKWSQVVTNFGIDYPF